MAVFTLEYGVYNTERNYTLEWHKFTRVNSFITQAPGLLSMAEDSRPRGCGFETRSNRTLVSRSKLDLVADKCQS